MGAVRLTRTLACAFVVLVALSGFMMFSLGVALAKRESAALPSVAGLAVHVGAATSVMFDGAGREVGRFAEQNRMPVRLADVPPLMVRAFLSAEDRNYYRHRGVDPGAVVRALTVNLRNQGSGRRPVGASTITQQVAKNMLVGDDITLRRKFREMLIALRMDRELGKDRVLEIYLNEIYLGEGSYGVAAASEAWFGRPAAALNLAETAFIAGLPKAPSAYDPRRRPEAARARRAYVLGRMADDGVITAEQAREASLAPLPVPRGLRHGNAASGWFPEEARREVVARLGTTALYRGGLRVTTSLDPAVQEIAERVLRDGLIAFDRRHGWRGPLGNIPNARAAVPATWVSALAQMDIPEGSGEWLAGVMLGMETVGRGVSGSAVIGFSDGSWSLLPPEGVRWAARAGPRGIGSAPRTAADVLRLGDVVLVSRTANGRLELRQIPEVQGSLIAMESATGRVLAVAGGFEAGTARFNRAVQGRRQPGSAFKTIIYMTAFELGYDPTSPVLDAPIALDSGPGQRWRPDGGNAMGLMTTRRALELSRNLAAVRLLNEVGLESVSALATQLGVYDRPLANMASGLGAVETTNMRLTAAYAMMANGGQRVHPGFVDAVRDVEGATVWARPGPGEQILDPLASARMISVLEGVVRRGTAASYLARNPLAMAGKTGTTNDNHDAWFVGMVPGMAVGVHIGYDRPRDMGPRETGGAAASPVFGEFARETAAIRPRAAAFPIPPGVRVLRVDPTTGEESRTGQPELFPAR